MDFGVAVVGAQRASEHLQAEIPPPNGHVAKHQRYIRE